jgi:DNA-binding NarL/FixJ family response regulator
MKAFLAASEGMQICGVVKNTEELASRIQDYPFVILLVDIEALNISFEDLKTIMASFPNVRVVVLSQQVKSIIVTEIVQSGVSAFLTKDCDQQELIHAIRTVAKGEKYYSQPMLNAIIQATLEPKPTPQKHALTVREAELLRLIAQGYSNQKAAEVMNLSPHTVHTHRKKITRKLNIKSPTEFLVHALDLGIVKLPATR